MSYRNIILAFGFSIFAVFSLWLLSSEVEKGHMVYSSSKGNASSSSSLLDKILSNEIIFYGQVLDLEGNPVAHAKVEYASLSHANFDKVWTGGGGPNKILYADENGRFEIHEVGGSLYVQCSHPDYYSLGNDISAQKFGYGFQVGNAPAWDLSNPAILRLRKKGIREPLYFSNSRLIGKGKARIPIYEEECAINLANGKSETTDTSIYISYRSDKKDKADKEYTWEYTLRIPGGGFVAKQEDFDFIAPEDGYSETIKIGFNRGNKKWNYFRRCFYFVKFPNGLRGIFEIYTNYDGGIYFQALVNPNPASRNLEYDYGMQINKRWIHGRYTRL